MEGWGHELPPALYLAGCFRVELAGFATVFSDEQLRKEFRHNCIAEAFVESFD
jgi:hypothetical protein